MICDKWCEYSEEVKKEIDVYIHTNAPKPKDAEEIISSNFPCE